MPSWILDWLGKENNPSWTGRPIVYGNQLSVLASWSNDVRTYLEFLGGRVSFSPQAWLPLRQPCSTQQHGRLLAWPAAAGSCWGILLPTCVTTSRAYCCWPAPVQLIVPAGCRGCQQGERGMVIYAQRNEEGGVAIRQEENGWLASFRSASERTATLASAV
jgi:hypothetical protein